MGDLEASSPRRDALDSAPNDSSFSLPAKTGQSNEIPSTSVVASSTSSTVEPIRVTLSANGARMFYIKADAAQTEALRQSLQNQGSKVTLLRKVTGHARGGEDGSAAKGRGPTPGGFEVRTTPQGHTGSERSQTMVQDSEKTASEQKMFLGSNMHISHQPHSDQHNGQSTSTTSPANFKEPLVGSNHTNKQAVENSQCVLHAQMELPTQAKYLNTESPTGVSTPNRGFSRPAELHDHSLLQSVATSMDKSRHLAQVTSPRPDEPSTDRAHIHNRSAINPHESSTVQLEEAVESEIDASPHTPSMNDNLRVPGSPGVRESTSATRGSDRANPVQNHQKNIEQLCTQELGEESLPKPNRWETQAPYSAASHRVSTAASWIPGLEEFGNGQAMKPSANFPNTARKRKTHTHRLMEHSPQHRTQLKSAQLSNCVETVWIPGSSLLTPAPVAWTSQSPPGFNGHAYLPSRPAAHSGVVLTSPAPAPPARAVPVTLLPAAAARPRPKVVTLPNGGKLVFSSSSPDWSPAASASAPAQEPPRGAPGTRFLQSSRPRAPPPSSLLTLSPLEMSPDYSRCHTEERTRTKTESYSPQKHSPFVELLKSKLQADSAPTRSHKYRPFNKNISTPTDSGLSGFDDLDAWGKSETPLSASALQKGLQKALDMTPFSAFMDEEDREEEEDEEPEENWEERRPAVAAGAGGGTGGGTGETGGQRTCGDGTPGEAGGGAEGPGGRGIGRGGGRGGARIGGAEGATRRGAEEAGQGIRRVTGKAGDRGGTTEGAGRAGGKAKTHLQRSQEILDEQLQKIAKNVEKAESLLSELRKTNGIQEKLAQRAAGDVALENTAKSEGSVPAHETPGIENSVDKSHSQGDTEKSHKKPAKGQCPHHTPKKTPQRENTPKSKSKRKGRRHHPKRPVLSPTSNLMNEILGQLIPLQINDVETELSETDPLEPEAPGAPGGSSRGEGGGAPGKETDEDAERADSVNPSQVEK